MNDSYNADITQIKCSPTIKRISLPVVAALLTILFTAANPGQQNTADWKRVEQAFGKAGSLQPGDVYKVSLPRTDLKITAGGVGLKPALALGSWVAFKKTAEMTMVMGDLVLTEDEVTPVLTKL